MKNIEIIGVTKNISMQTMSGERLGVPLSFIGSKTDVVENMMKSIYEQSVTINMTA